VFKQEHKQSLTMDQVRRQVDADHAGVEFSDAELWAALDSMQDDNQVMVSENVVFLIWTKTSDILTAVVAGVV